MRRPAWIVVGAFALVATVPWAAWAQYRTTSSGTFGSRTIGQAMGGATSSAFGGSGFGRGSGLGSGMGMGIGLDMGMGTKMGLGTGTGSRSGSRFGSTSSSLGNVRHRFATGEQGSFIGADTSDIRPDILGGLTGSSRSGSSAASSSSSRYTRTTSDGRSRRTTRSSATTSGRQSPSRGAYGANSSGEQVLLGLDMAFDVSRPFGPQLSSVVTSRLAKSMRWPAGVPVAVSMAGDTALLEGVVATEHDRALAEQLVRLEPGVAQVVNRLRVDPTGARRTPPR